MHRIARNLMVYWMVATTAHLPFPICDGDNVGSAGRHGIPVISHDQGIDIDFVFLGCDHPDDPDDGPVDNDRDENDTCVDAFPSFLRSLNISTVSIGKSKTWWPAHHGMHSTSYGALALFATADEDIRREIFPTATQLDAISPLRC